MWENIIRSRGWTEARLDGYSVCVVNISSIDKLTPREREILVLAAGRLGDKEIAQKLGLSPRTIQNHLHRAYEKLGVSNRTQAARLLSDFYSEEPTTLSLMPLGSPHKVVVEGVHTSSGDGTPELRPSKDWRRPRKRGGSILWLILLWALAWIMIALVGASLINPVLELVERLR